MTKHKSQKKKMTARKKVPAVKGTHPEDHKPFITWVIGLLVVIVFVLFFSVGKQLLIGRAGYQMGLQEPGTAGVSSPDAVIAGEFFSVDVFAHLGDQGSPVSQFTLTYDENFLENPIVTLPEGYISLQREIDDGEVRVSSMVLPPNNQLTGEVKLATVQFQVKDNAAVGLAEGESRNTQVELTDDLTLFDDSGAQIRFDNFIVGEVQIDARVCFEGDVQVCNTGIPGICADGTQVCVNNVWGDCVQNNPPADEVCNGLNDDCDSDEDGNSLIDEDDGEEPLCLENNACIIDQCVLTCPNGVVDVNLEENCLSCPQDVLCEEGSLCNEFGQCEPLPNPCDGVECDEGFGCDPDNGQCVIIPGVCDPVCDAGEQCVNEVCVEIEECDADNLDLCDTENKCINVDLYWWNGICNIEEEPECGPDYLLPCTEENCADAADGHWYNNRCNEEPEEFCEGNDDCAENERCVDEECVVAVPRGMTISVSQEEEVFIELIKQQTYTISAKLQAGDNPLQKRIIIIQLLDNDGKALKVHSESKPGQLAANREETVSFDYEIPSGLTGEITIYALAWTKWLNEGGQPIENTFVEEVYEVH